MNDRMDFDEIFIVYKLKHADFVSEIFLKEILIFSMSIFFVLILSVIGVRGY